LEDKDPNAAQRKSDHIELAFRARTETGDQRFDYEPFFSPHPGQQSLPSVAVGRRMMLAPLWVSSMTGGAEKAGMINKRLALVCKEFGLGMGLGSCRQLLEDDNYLKDFALRPFIGEQPLFANLGIAQLEKLAATGRLHLVNELVEKLEADGLIIHVNPLQEWLQPEGDRIETAPMETIQRVLDSCRFPVMVKEVGQGFGPKSMRALLRLPLEALDFAAQGGTNFSLLEMLRADPFVQEQYEGLANIGHCAMNMTETLLQILQEEGAAVRARNIIVSGGINGFLDGYWHLRKIPMSAMYAQASAFLKPALESEEKLFAFVESQLEGLRLAYTYLNLRK
jgi:isopentenyl-diphosphate delta-isomerase